MKKCALIILILVSSFVFISNVEAKTLGDLKKELNSLETKMENNKKQKEMTEAEKKKTEGNIEKIKGKIAKADKDIGRLAHDVKSLNKDIKVKKKEIEDLASYLQLSNGKPAYLEYAFGSESFTDFIYRLAVAEQLTKYNDEVVKDYNKSIKKVKNKNMELKSKQSKLGKMKKEYELESAKLGEKIEFFEEGRLDINKDLKAQRDVINLYKSMGCSDKDDIKGSCGNDKLEAASSGGSVKKSKPKKESSSSSSSNNNSSNSNNKEDGNKEEVKPPVVSSGFIRPLTSGRVSSNYGWRLHPTQGVSKLHSGIDLTKSGTVPVYAAAGGIVVSTVSKSSCGGNIVYIHHRIDGKNYTSVYMHLRSMNVKKGQTVSTSTKVGIMGGNPKIETYDKCSTGQHLHFTLANGLYFKEYTSYNTFLNKTFNPRNKVSFPSVGGSFSGR